MGLREFARRSLKRRFFSTARLRARAGGSRVACGGQGVRGSFSRRSGGEGHSVRIGLIGGRRCELVRRRRLSPQRTGTTDRRPAASIPVPLVSVSKYAIRNLSGRLLDSSETPASRHDRSARDEMQKLGSRRCGVIRLQLFDRPFRSTRDHFPDLSSMVASRRVAGSERQAKVRVAIL